MTSGSRHPGRHLVEARKTDRRRVHRDEEALRARRQHLGAVLKRHADNQFLRMGVDRGAVSHESGRRGYPDGLKGAAIPLAARIVALADFYDALTHSAAIATVFSHEEYVRMVEGCGSTSIRYRGRFRILEGQSGASGKRCVAMTQARTAATPQSAGQSRG